jgi:hypothetical protein
MQQTTTTQGPALTLTAKPTIEQLQVWWKTMQHDDLSVAYTDSFPAALSDFRCEVDQGEKMLLLGLADGQIAGAMWLHDLVHRHDGTVSAGWFGCYFLPPYRGRLAIQLWQAARQYWEAAGVAHIFCAVHVANRLSQAFVTRGGSFHRVGKFPNFALYDGQPTDLFIYTLHAEDAALAWELAAERAARQVLV